MGPLGHIDVQELCRGGLCVPIRNVDVTRCMKQLLWLSRVIDWARCAD